MPNSVEAHYENHLGPIYEWMTGDFESACQSFREMFEKLDLAPSLPRTAVDLGCGHGLQTVPLVQLGFAVTAIDSCAHLLEQLKSHASTDNIAIVHGDLTEFPNYIDKKADLIVCMGDTLTHLESVNAVEELIRSVASNLETGGYFCTSFRDYSSNELTGTARFIPVRSDDERIHTCFLEYGIETVTVHDVVHQRSNDSWEMNVSAYPKIRLAPGSLTSFASQSGLELVETHTTRGMLYFTFRLTG